MEQCLVEQRYARGAQLRTLIYAQVSISGQALVFVVRSARHSLASLAGGLTYLAFVGAQIASTLIAALGFGGYATPPESVQPCSLCATSFGYHPTFWPSGRVPIAGTEGRFTASVIGCTYYFIVAWVWSLIWYVALDPLKWLLIWALNEDGVRSRASWKRFVRRRARDPVKTGEEAHFPLGPAAATYLNFMGRASLQRPSAAMLARASVISVEMDPASGLRRVSAATPRRRSLEVAGHLAALQSNQSLVATNPTFGCRASMERPAAAAAAAGQFGRRASMERPAAAAAAAATAAAAAAAATAAAAAAAASVLFGEGQRRSSLLGSGGYRRSSLPTSLPSSRQG
ncbi:hypothetical protein OEZ85_003205 [Tetradesmus obliquus]|uniref:Uncharacterized protein n=1 Tax=Tetradesmus obliquus TaxID=3088 RepID=A0ABY8TZY0_TETOB|nr:hypothetical protein OEZ85_003205 [Tetradesmus obliquus]